MVHALGGFKSSSTVGAVMLSAVRNAESVFVCSASGFVLR